MARLLRSTAQIPIEAANHASPGPEMKQQADHDAGVPRAAGNAAPE